MQEIAEAPLLPSGNYRPSPSLKPVRPLIDYLDSFEEKSEERELTFAEDAMAVFILKALVPANASKIAGCVEGFLDPRFKRLRTLGQWYLYAIHLAQHFARGD